MFIQPETGAHGHRLTEPSPGLRIHIGLEDPEDLIADLDAGFDRFNAVLKNG